MRILVVQRSLAPPGGGNGVAAWMVHALAGEHDVATITLAPWSERRVNDFYGTAIAEDHITHHVVPAMFRWLDGLPEHRATWLRMAAVLRCARRLARGYDLLITGDNYGAFPKPGMQYVHFPAAVAPAAHRLRPLVNLYFAACDAFVGIPREAAARNLTLANSRWTAAGLERRFGLEARVLYPPVVDPGGGLPWERRRDTFLCIGRFHPSKRIETAISIVRRLRAHSLPQARLVIIGSAIDRNYRKRLSQSTARDRDWIEFREDLSRAETNRLIGESRYAVQAMVAEHFGMATAELARGGCLVFAHRSGGSPEVINEPALLWNTEDDAVAQISALARDAAARDAARHHLREHTRAFSTGRFCDELRAVVNAWASRQLPEQRIA